MARLTAKDVINVEIPADLNDTLIVRCLEADFGISQKGNPQIISKWEIMGVPDGNGSYTDRIKRGDKEYVVAGALVSPVYHTLTPKAARFHQEFWAKATKQNKDNYDVDVENPDTSYYPGLAMMARCKALVVEQREKLTDEEKEKQIAEGIEKPQGKIIIDPETGESKKLTLVRIEEFSGLYKGDLPAF